MACARTAGSGSSARAPSSASREVEWNVLARVVTHYLGPFAGDPVVHLPVVPPVVLIRPVVRQARRRLRVGRARVIAERQEKTVGVARIWLLEHRIDVWQLHRTKIIESAHPGHRAGVMVEAPVLLHQDHHVLDV
jgi:hypothetical protein